jgi:hypothetical protein
MKEEEKLDANPRIYPWIKIKAKASKVSCAIIYLWGLLHTS